MTDDRDDRPLNSSDEDRAYALAVIAAAIYPHTDKRLLSEERRQGAVGAAVLLHDHAREHVRRERSDDAGVPGPATERLQAAEKVVEALWEFCVRVPSEDRAQEAKRLYAAYREDYPEDAGD